VREIRESNLREVRERNEGTNKQESNARQIGKQRMEHKHATYLQVTMLCPAFDFPFGGVSCSTSELG
jgi:hypothetical protein